MENKISVTFKSANVLKSLEVTKNITVKELIKEFASLYKLTIDQVKSDIIFLYGGTNFYVSYKDKTLSEINYNPGNPILIYDRMNLLNPQIIAQENKINDHQHLLRNQAGKGDESTKIVVSGTLEDMAIYGCLLKEKTEAESKQFPDKFISTDQAIEMKQNDEQFFILGLLGKYLEALGVKVFIENCAPDLNQTKYNTNILQFLINGMMFEKKYYLTFNGNPCKIGQLNMNPIERSNMIMYLKTTLAQIYNIPIDQLIVAPYPQLGTFKIIVIFKQNPNIIIDLNYLRNKFSTDNDLSGLNLIEVKESPIIDGVKLNKSMLDFHGDCKDKTKWPTKIEKRGNQFYYPPEDWIRYGLKVWKQYDNGNNDWLSFNNIKGEWCIAYYGAIDCQKNKEINDTYENDKNKNKDHPNQKVGRGTFITKYPKKMQEYAIKVGNYQIGFMVRVKPGVMRIPSKDDGYWVVNGTPDEIRPYGILIRDI